MVTCLKLPCDSQRTSLGFGFLVKNVFLILLGMHEMVAWKGHVYLPVSMSPGKHICVNKYLLLHSVVYHGLVHVCRLVCIFRGVCLNLIIQDGVSLCVFAGTASLQNVCHSACTHTVFLQCEQSGVL